jgi:hypothetical protein
VSRGEIARARHSHTQRVDLARFGGQGDDFSLTNQGLALQWRSVPVQPDQEGAFSNENKPPLIVLL